MQAYVLHKPARCWLKKPVAWMEMEMGMGMGWITIVRHGLLQVLDVVTQLPSLDTRGKSKSMALSDLQHQIGPAHQIPNSHGKTPTHIRCLPA